MAKGKKTGGRQKGSVNKDTLPCEMKAKEMGIDVFQALLHFVEGNNDALNIPDDDQITTEQRLKAILEACQYLHTKRKSLDTNINLESEAGFKITVEDYTKK